MLTLLLLLCAGQSPPGGLKVTRGTDALELSWSDAEDRVQGFVRPRVPRTGEPMTVSINLGSFEGAQPEGPLTVTLGREGETHGETVTVKRGPGGYSASLHPTSAGRYWLDVSFRTTRYKALHAELDVADAPLPSWWWLALIVAAGGGLILFVGGRLWNGARSEAQ